MRSNVVSALLNVLCCCTLRKGVEILPFNGSYDLMKRHLSAAQLDVYKNQCVFCWRCKFVRC